MTGLQQFDLRGRRALITGGSKGLGQAIGHALAEVGAEVVIVSRNLAECAKVATEIYAATSQRAFGYAADVTQRTDVERLQREVGQIDILFNSAGINIRNPVADLTEADWDAVVDCSLKGSFLMARAFGPAMAQRGWGRIINFGSIMSVVSLPGRAAYAAAKAGLLGLTRTLALEWAERGVTVNAICPGPFGTEMNKPLLADPAKYADFVSRIPMRRWGELREITGPALFLASDASSFVTGSSLFVDGGWTAQ